MRKLLKNAKADLRSGKIHEIRTELAGDKILALADTDIDISNMLAEMKSEGVTDEDIRSWYNLHNLECALIVNIDDFHRMRTV